MIIRIDAAENNMTRLKTDKLVLSDKIIILSANDYFPDKLLNFNLIVEIQVVALKIHGNCLIVKNDFLISSQQKYFWYTTRDFQFNPDCHSTARGVLHP